MQFTLSRAAKEAGISKSTLSKALSSGRISGERQEDGSFRIEPAELFRVFPKRTAEHVRETGLVTVREPPEKQGEQPAADVAILQLKVQMLEEQLARERALHEQDRDTARETVADLRKRLDRSEERVLALTVVPSPPAAPPATVAEVATPAPAVPPRPRGGLLSRLFGRA